MNLGINSNHLLKNTDLHIVQYREILYWIIVYYGVCIFFFFFFYIY